MPQSPLPSLTDPDALPQILGDFRPLDEWQQHINQVFYALRFSHLNEYSRTFATADYRLAHALAADYYRRALDREKAPPPSPPPSRGRVSGRGAGVWLTVLELGCGNGNLAACFLSHLKRLDREGTVYPRVRYLLVDRQERALETALHHPDLAEHRARVGTLLADAQDLGQIKDGSVDRVLCNELWNELPTKLMLRKEGEVMEEYLRPNLSATKHAVMSDWSGFVRAFAAADVSALRSFPPFLDDIVWEREYRPVEWQSVPYRKVITAFLKDIDEEVLVPVNVGAYSTIKEAKRILASDAIGFSSFDAGTADLNVLNDPEKPCYGQFGGQYSFMVNYALVDAVAKHLEVKHPRIESQKEFVGRNLGANVMSLVDLLATHPRAGSLTPSEQDRLVLKTIQALNSTSESPYQRPIDFPLRPELPVEEREMLQGILHSLKRDGVPDTIAYLAEEEILGVLQGLEALGYDRGGIRVGLSAQPRPVDYFHHFF